MDFDGFYVISDEIQNLSECIHVRKFEVVCEAVKTLSGYDYQTGIYKVPSLALRLGQSLTKCAQSLRGKAIREGRSYLKKQCDDFLDIAKEDWKLQVFTQARQNIDERIGQTFNIGRDIYKYHGFVTCQNVNREFVHTPNISNVWKLY